MRAALSAVGCMPLLGAACHRIFKRLNYNAAHVGLICPALETADKTDVAIKPLTRIRIFSDEATGE
jgi:hypothetical protein